jgi:hypothetical protein
MMNRLNRYGKETSGAGILNYHSSREERLALSPRLAAIQCERDRPPRGILGKLFGRSKGARLTLLNLAALVLIFVFYQVVVARAPAGIWSGGGFQFSASAFAREDKALVSVRVKQEKNGAAWKTPPEITLRSAGVSETFVPALPLKKGEISYIRAVLPLEEAASGEARSVSCRIVFAETTKDIRVLVKEE